MADITHPQPWFLIEALNVLLNMDALNRQETYAEDCEPLMHAVPLKVPLWSRGLAPAPEGLLGLSMRGENGLVRDQGREAGSPRGAIEGTPRLAAHMSSGRGGKTGHSHVVHKGGHVIREGAGEAEQGAVQVATHVWRTVTGEANHVAVRPGAASLGESTTGRKAAIHQIASVGKGSVAQQDRDRVGRSVGEDSVRLVVGGQVENESQRGEQEAKHGKHVEREGLKVSKERTERERRLPSRFHVVKRILG